MRSRETRLYDVVRQRIEEVKEPYRYGLMFQYLAGARVSEVCGRWAFTRDDYEVADFEGEPVLVCILKTAKRRGRERAIALPLNPEYEPWSRDLLRYFEECRGVPFDWSRWTQWNYARRAFDGLTYQIEDYVHPRVKRLIGRHERDLRTHGLRHIRATELINVYRFNPVQLATFMGWKLSSALGGSRTMDRYVSLQWHDYFPKLLKRRR